MFANPRTTLAGIVACLLFLSHAIAEPGPWTLARGIEVALGVAFAFFGAVAKDHAATEETPALVVAIKAPPLTDRDPPAVAKGGGT